MSERDHDHDPHSAAQGRATSPRDSPARDLAHTRRFVIKTRLVVLKQAGPRSTETHLRYLERDGVGRAGERG